jgi:transposase
VSETSEISILRAENAALRQQVASLEEKVMLLLQRLEGKAVKKDSHNSHSPPSQDKPGKVSRSLRQKSGRKPGGQPGHGGHTLKMVAVADVVEEVKSNYCQACGAALPEEQVVVSTRQVVDIPPVQPVYTEYRQYGCACPGCDHFQKATYPPGVNAPIQYGPRVAAYVSYLSVYEYLPYQRLCLLMKDVFGLPFSEGSISNLLSRAAAKATPVYEAIQAQLQQASYVGSDETGAKVKGTSWWIWAWQNAKNTFLKASAGRGSQTIEDTFPNGLPKATLGSDRWAAQLKTTSKAKQLCLAHLQRDLIYLEESEKSPWATHCKTLFEQALQLDKQAQERGQAFRPTEKQAYQIEHRLNRLLTRTIDQKQYPETLTFQRSMIKYRDCLLVFLYDLEIPPDNNASERAIRNVKVKQKVSGQFKTGQHTFCILRSVIDTLKKRDLDIFAYLSQIMASPAT